MLRIRIRSQEGALLSARFSVWFALIHVLWSGFFFLSVRSSWLRCKDQTRFSGMHQTQKARAQLIWFYVCLSCVCDFFFSHSFSLCLVYICCCCKHGPSMCVAFHSITQKENNGLLNHNIRNIEPNIFMCINVSTIFLHR